MNKRLGSKLDMFRTTRDLRGNPAYTAALASVVGIANGFTALAAHISQIETLDVARAGAALGGGVAKSTARKLFTLSLLVADGIFTAFASAGKDADLLHRVNNEASDFANMSDEELRAHGEYLLGLVPAAIPQPLSDLGLDTATATALQQRYATYHTLLTLPATKAEQETTPLTLIDTEFTAADTLLDLTLDKLMRRFAETHPALTAAYEQARFIHDAPTGKAPTPTPVPPKPPTP